MSLAIVPLTSANFTACLPLWADRCAYQPVEFELASMNARRLLDDGRALGSLITDQDQHDVRAFGMSVFVDCAFLDTYLEHPHPQIGKLLLLGAYVPGEDVALTVEKVAEGNCHDGLHLVVVNANVDASAPNVAAAAARLVEAFFDVHRGYRIRRLLNEGFSADAILSLESAGMTIVLRTDRLRPCIAGPSVVGVMTREQAVASKTILIQVFIYDPPRLHLTDAEQQLLRATLTGCTDEQLSATLEISLSAVKARWTRIQQRVMQYAPEVFESVRPRIGDHRGAQSRHLLLEYVRQHRSELTPYAWQSDSEAGAQAASHTPRRR